MLIRFRIIIMISVVLLRCSSCCINDDEEDNVATNDHDADADRDATNDDAGEPCHRFLPPSSTKHSPNGESLDEPCLRITCHRKEILPK